MSASSVIKLLPPPLLLNLPRAVAEVLRVLVGGGDDSLLNKSAILPNTYTHVLHGGSGSGGKHHTPIEIQRIGIRIV